METILTIITITAIILGGKELFTKRIEDQSPLGLFFFIGGIIMIFAIMTK